MRAAGGDEEQSLYRVYEHHVRVAPSLCYTIPVRAGTPGCNKWLSIIGSLVVSRIETFHSDHQRIRRYSLAARPPPPPAFCGRCSTARLDPSLCDPRKVS